MYKVLFTNNARKEYEYLFKKNRTIFKKVRSALIAIAENPLLGKPLKLTLKGKRSYRVGVYRIIYSAEKKVLQVIILDIGHRKKIYR
jgi:mRNA interferase RelE/StbE